MERTQGTDKGDGGLHVAEVLEDLSFHLAFLRKRYLLAEFARHHVFTLTEVIYAH